MTPSVPPPPPPQPPRTRPATTRGGLRPAWRTRARRVLPYVLVSGAGFVIAYLVVYLFVFPSRLVTNDRAVPNVVGMLQVDAERALRTAGFRSQTGNTRVNASVPPETVVLQSPPATTMKPAGTIVTLDVARAP